MLDFLKKYLNSINSYIPQYDDKFFHRMIENFMVNFIVFIYHFKLR